MHHSRRKSGHGSSANTSMTDVRKAVAASDVSSSRHKPSRRNTSQATAKASKSSRDRERERGWDDERAWEDERESFPQFCMSCEKQFVPQDDRFLYCSEACRAHDQNNAPAPTSATPSRAHRDANYAFYASGDPEPRDIIPRASPSRPNSVHYSAPVTPSGASQMSAITALRSLTIRDPSPPSPTMTATYHGSSIWPFARGSTTSPGSSYTRPTSTVFSSTYDTSYYGNYGNYAGYGGAAGYSMASTDRPLPVRRPGNYSRPKSIELVTPMVGR